MKASLLSLSILSLSFLFAGLSEAGPRKSPADLSAGPPALEKNLSSENYVEFETRRLKNAWVGWCDYAWLRDHGIDVPAEGLANADFHTALLDAFAYQVPHSDDPPGAFTEKTKKYYADYYGGYGTSRNKGSARAGSAGLVNEKGIGQSPLLNSSDRFHSNGAAKSIEGIDEAIWGGILDRELPHGSNRVIAVIFTGTFGRIPGKNPGDPDEIFPRALVVREDAVRPAHFQTNIRIEEGIETKRLLALGKLFASNLPLPKGYRPVSEADRIRVGLLELVDRRADQYAAHYARRFYHGSSSPSNLEITGADLDLGDQTAQPGFAKIVRIKDESPFGEIQSQVDIFDDLLGDLPKTIGPERARALPSLDEVRARFERRFHSARAREMIALAGFPGEVVDGLAKEKVTEELGDVLVELTRRGNEEWVWIGGAPIPNPGHYNVEKILNALAERSHGSAADLSASLVPFVDDAVLRENLANRYFAYHSRARAYAAVSGVGERAFEGYLIAAAAIRNAPRPSLYRGDVRWRALWDASDAGNVRGDRKAISDYIENTIWSNVRTFRDTAPYELVLANEVFSAPGVSLRRVYSARLGKKKSVLRLEASGDHASFFGHSFTLDELERTKLTWRGTSVRPRRRGNAIEFEIFSEDAVLPEELTLFSKNVARVPHPEFLKNRAGFHGEFLIEKSKCVPLLDRAS